MAGLVYSAGHKMEKPGSQVDRDVDLTIKGPEFPWVSRGGVKLDYALSKFSINVSGAICLDIGASTGGFTDVLLARGASKIYAVDVGYGQLDWKLRNNSRVVVIERTNARYLTKEIIPQPVMFLCCDASFISLKTLLPRGMDIVGKGGQLVALIKPQFEVGKEYVEKKGLVKDQSQHELVCDGIRDWIGSYSGWSVIDLVSSPITGTGGNKEFLIGAFKHK